MSSGFCSRCRKENLFCGVPLSTYVRIVCTIIDHTIQFIEHIGTSNNAIIQIETKLFKRVCTTPWGLVEISVPCWLSCSIWLYVSVLTTIVQTCSTRQKRPKQDQNDQNKVTKTHHILQDQNDRNKTKTTKTKSQKHKTIHSTVQCSDNYK